MLLVDVWNGFLEALKVPALSSNDFWLVNCRAATPEMADSRDNILIVIDVSVFSQQFIFD